MRPHVLSIAPYGAAVANSIAAAQTPAAGGVQSLTLTSTPVTLDVPRQVQLTFAGADSARTFVIEGADEKGNVVIEAIPGANAGTSQTVRQFKTVTSILVDANTAGSVQAGTTTVVDTDWFPLEYNAPSFEVGLILLIPTGTGTPNFTVQATMSRLGWLGDTNSSPIGNLLAPTKFQRSFPNLVIANHDVLAAVTTTGATGTPSNIFSPCTAIRLRSNQVFTTNTVKLAIAQASAPR